MNLEFLKNFISIVEAGGFNKASKEIHVAQPALSRQMAILEKEYGMPLISSRQGSHTLTLTEAGWVVYRAAKQMVETEENTLSELSTLKAGLTGTLRLSTVPSYGPELAAGVLPRFHAAYPLLNFRVRESYYLPLVEEVRKGISEIGIANAPPPDPSSFSILFHRDAPLTCAIPESFSLSPAPSIDLEALAKLPLAISRSSEAVLKKRFPKEFPTLPVRFTFDTRSSTLAAAKAGLAAAIITGGQQEEIRGLTFSTLRGTETASGQTIFALKNHLLSRGMVKFVEMYQTILFERAEKQ